MRTQKILRRVDAVRAQGRYVLWLACDHKVSVTDQDLMMMTSNQRYIFEHDPDYNCPFCPDPPPQVVQAAKTPQQLYKEAGEP